MMVAPDPIALQDDLAHIAEDHFIDRSESLREEWYTILGKEYTENEWLASSLDFLNHHRFQTPYGQQVLRRKKSRNICRLMSAIYPLAA